MRHRIAGRHLNRTSAHRRALRRNLAASLFEHGTISTTLEKAKFVKPFAERLITLARDGSLHARRRAVAMLNDRNICTIENGEAIPQSTVIRKLFSEIGPRYVDRPGGYTRIIRLPLRRLGDNGRLVLLQLVEEKMESKSRRQSSPEAPTTPAPAPGAPEEQSSPDQPAPDAVAVEEPVTTEEQNTTAAAESSEDTTPETTEDQQSAEEKPDDQK